MQGIKKMPTDGWGWIAALGLSVTWMFELSAGIHQPETPRSVSSQPFLNMTVF
jgi:hypothetical protein